MANGGENLSGYIEDAVESVVLRMLSGVHTATPAKIVAYDSDGTVTVQPAVGSFDEKGAALPLPEITGVPVLFPGVGVIEVNAPLLPGDDVLLIICESPIDSWLNTKAITTESDSRRFSLTDAVCLPLFRKRNEKYNDVVIRDRLSGAAIKFEKSGAININNGALRVLK